MACHASPTAVNRARRCGTPRRRGPVKASTKSACAGFTSWASSKRTTRHGAAASGFSSNPLARRMIPSKSSVPVSSRYCSQRAITGRESISRATAASRPSRVRPGGLLRRILLERWRHARIQASISFVIRRGPARSRMRSERSSCSIVDGEGAAIGARRRSFSRDTRSAGKLSPRSRATSISP